MPPYLPSQAVGAEHATAPRSAAPSQPSQRMAWRPWRGRALVLIGIVLAAFTLRLAVTSFTPLIAEIGTDIGFGSVMAGVFGMSAPAMFAIAGITAPRIMARIELERVALLSVLLTTAGLALRPLMGSPAPMLAATTLALYGMGIGNIVLPPLVKRYFSDRLALISTLYITFVQLGTVVPAVVAIPVADQHGWRASLAIWAFVAAAAVLPWIGLRNAFPSNASRNAASATSPGDASHAVIATPPTGRPWRSPVGWGLAVMFGMTSLITYSFLTWLPTMLTDAGVDRVEAGAYLGVFILSGLFAIMLVPAITTRMTNPFPLALASMTSLAIGMAGLAIAPAAYPLAWAILLGLGPSTFPMALTLINLRTRSAHAAGSLSGFTQGVGYLLACGGPLLVGLLHDATGGWTLALGLLAVAMVTLITGAYHACKPRVIEDTWS